MFQLAYADGEDSQLTISAKKLLRAGKVNFCWLKSSNIPANFTRTGLLEVFDWENAKRLSNGNFLVTKSGGNQCIFSKDFKFLSDLRTRYKGYYELQNGNLLSKTFKTVDYDDIEIITTITNDGQNINTPKELIFEKELENGDLLLYDGKNYGVYSVDLNLKKQYSNKEFDFFMIQKYELDMQDNYKYYLGQDIKIERITYDYIYDEDDYPISLYNYNIYDKKRQPAHNSTRCCSF